jgi:3-hydroxybutyryl-CoA dehydrogenase
MQIEQAAVVGGGLMGSGIAETIAMASIPVTLRDVDEAAIGGARTRVEASLDAGVRRGKLTAEQRHDALERIVFTTDMRDLDGADVVIEAVPEHLELKVKVLAEVSAVVGPETLIASNTSSIPVAQLAARIPSPERVLGLHFFSPVPVMKLIEIVEALPTSAETLVVAHDFAERLGKTPIHTKDRSGFIVNMLLVPYLMEAVRMLEQGFASREDIDEGMRLGCGHPMGPLTLADFIGLDVLYAIGNSLYDEFKLAQYAPAPLLKRMVASGWIGRKSGRGFYEYGPAAT